MKYLDEIEITTSKYEKFGIPIGTKGVIILAAMRNNCFECELFDLAGTETYSINIKDMKVLNSSNVADKEILNDLPKHNPSWWCKVENGFIINLKGEKKNKIPFNYDS